MKTMHLFRVAQNIDGMFGAFVDENIAFGVTLEPRWNNNKENESCIPPDDYICKRVISPKFGNTFEITNVPERKHILIHSGVVLKHTTGCVIIGEQFEPYEEHNAVLFSGKAFAEFLERTKGMDSFILKIVDVRGWD